ncbi:MAG: DUF1579 family protein [Kangiellaceae bacterium]|jgi:hypothetical protein|nr:DUF1579 family protein [Kangiellaceae bacterium]
MVKPQKSFIFSLFFAALSTSLFAATPKVSEVPLKMMRKLDMLSGEWQLSGRMTMNAGKTWSEIAPNRIEISSQHRGMLLTEQPVKLSNTAFNMLSFLTYDQYRKVYRKAAIDDTWGIMDLYEGKIVDNQLVLTNLKSQTFFPIGNDTWRAFRITMELKADKRKMVIEASDDRGQSWQPNFEMTYRKIG